jgi:GTP-binding protein YchF
MKVGIVGLPASGKSTLFNALTRGHAETGRFGSGRAEINRGRVLVPDERLDWLAEHYSPKKKTPATVEFLDVPGLSPGSAEKGAAALIADLRTVEALLEVVRVFDDPAVPHPDGSVDPVRDADNLETELILADLGIVEKRLHRVESDLGKGVDKKTLEPERDVLVKVKAALEDGKTARTLGLTDQEEHRLRGLALLTLKPKILLGNVGEDEAAAGDSDAKLRARAEADGIPYLRTSAKIEAELAEMDDEDAAAFLSDLGIERPSRDLVVKAAFDALRQITFLTFGEDECRAWTVSRDADAVEAAGKIHSDIARGFIRAEIVAFDELHGAGSWAAAKEHGKHRLEGKEYRMKDGDCVIFRFNV